MGISGISLPPKATADIDEIRATYDEGILTVSVPVPKWCAGR
jgi:HSP20 family molecular chaperone IbpA